MACLAVASYDPASVVLESTASLLAMTAMDTTNLRLTFTAPANGAVLVRLRGITAGATTFARILLGILDGSTVRMRMSPLGQNDMAFATRHQSQECIGIITGLTPGNSYTWDAAYGVEIAVAATNIKYGGPNDATADTAYGAFVFEIWTTENLLGSCLYDPAAAVTKSVTAALAMTAIDTTNLRITFTAPASGCVQWRIHTVFHGNATIPQVLLGILEGSTVRQRIAPIAGRPQTVLATSCTALWAEGIVSGLTPGNSYSYDAAYGVEVVSAGGGIKYGGPNNTTTDDAFGAFAFEIWTA